MNPQLQLMLQQAIQAFQGGNFDRAESILKSVLQVNPKNLPALHILGLIKASQAHYKDAVLLLARAAKISPNEASIQYNLAKALADSGSDKESIPHHKKAVELAPNNPEVWLNYGKTSSNLSRYDEALSYFDKALSLKPDYAEAYLNKGAVLKDLNRHEEAILFADKALTINPSLSEAWFNKGLALHVLKRYEEALAHYDKAIGLKPDYAEAWSNKGIVLNELNHYEEALAHYDKAIGLKPDYAAVWSNKGLALHVLKRYEEALAHYDKAIRLKPDYAAAWSNKGLVLHVLKRYEEALAHYDKAIRLKPDYAEAWSNKGIVLKELKRYEEALAHYDKAIGLKPNIDWVYGDYLHLKMKVCSWDNFEEEIKNLTRKVWEQQKVIQPFSLLSLTDDSLLHKKSSEIYAQDKYPFSSTLGPISRHSKNNKIRLGYFSPDFRNHPVSFLTAELFEIHDRSRFEVVAFCLQGAADNDEMRLRLKKGFDSFIDVQNMSDLEIAQLARGMEIDIAIDLSGPTQYSRTGIFSYRAAPIQVNWLGYPGTIGADFFDYIVADKIVIPELNRHFYNEKIVYLPHTYMVDDSKRIASSKVFSRKGCGLPENTFIFCCFNNDYKFNAQVLDSWSRILLEVKKSVLWISENNEQFKANITIEFERRGIGYGRLIFAERLELMTDHLARCALADLFLDTFPYNAHTTAVDSLKAGIPVVTCLGNSFAGRVGSSLLNAVELPELITNTQEEYEALAIEFATNPLKLARMKKKLAENQLTTPLFNAPLFTGNLEAAYQLIMEHYWKDMPPEHIYV